MALFKIAKGPVSTLTTTNVKIQEGFCYFTPENGRFYIDTADDRIPLNSVMYGECSTAAATAAKEVTIYGFKLFKGAQVTIKFTNQNSVANPTLTINNGETSTNAIPIMRYGTTVASTGTTTSGWVAGSVMTFTYDGTNWVRDYWYNTTYSYAKYNTSGLVKPAYSTTGAVTLTTTAAASAITPTLQTKTNTSNRYYGVEIDKNGVLFVNVPWTDNNTTYTFTNENATLAWGTTSTIATVGGVDIKVTMPTNPDTNTHYTTRLYTGASGAATAHAAATNPYLTVTDNNTYRNQVRFVGSGATTIKSDTSGNITISSTNTTYSNMTAATASAAGKAGLVPAPAAGKQNSFLRGDGTWVVPTNTTYSAFTGATSSAAGKEGLVPAPASGKTGLFLRSDGTWYDLIAIDGTTLDTFAELKAAWESADSTLTTTLNNAIGAKQDKITGAATTITSSNLIANRALISNGSGKVAVSAVTSTELGYLDGVTSAIQTQLNARASSATASGTAPLTLDASITNGKLSISGSVANASTTAAGVVTTSTQSFAGEKTFQGGVKIRTSAGSYPLVIQRTGDGEATKIYQDDSSLYFDMTNDETSCATTFKYSATDTEGSDGTNAHTASITMGMNSSGATYVTAGTFNGALAAGNITGTLGVAHGGTGATTFTSGALLIGNGTSAVGTRAIRNNTSKGALGWTSASADTVIPTVNTIAYWNGAYQGTFSNLTYCTLGAFGAAAIKGVTDSSSASAIGTGTSLPTERDIYYGLPTINNSHSYTSSTTIYAPSAGGTAGQYLKAVGTTSTPTWASFAALTVKTKDVAGTEATKATYTPATAATATIGPDDLFKIHSYSVTKALSLNTWTDVATAANLGSPATGTYIIQVTAGSAVYSGVMTWDATTTAVSGLYDEVLLHSASTSTAHVTARVNRDSSLRLQLCALDEAVASGTITVKMRRMI